MQRLLIYIYKMFLHIFYLFWWGFFSVASSVLDGFTSYLPQIIISTRMCLSTLTYIFSRTVMSLGHVWWKVLKCFKSCFVSLRALSIAWPSVDLSSVMSYNIHLRALWQDLKIPISITKRLKIVFLKSCLNPPGINELMTRMIIDIWSLYRI